MKVEDIKFKAKSILDEAWVQGDLIHKEDGKIAILRNGFNVSEVDPSTVCQFTGLKDCEGNEIWEGDLLANRYFKDIYEVVWREDDACFKIVNTRYRERTELLGYSLRNISWRVVGKKLDKKK